MADEIRVYSVNVPANTPIITPATTDVSFPARVVRQIQIRVPPGPNGELGFQIANSGIAVIPINTGGWLIANDELVDLPITSEHDNGSWQVIAYNTGSYAHMLSVRFFVDLLPGWRDNSQAVTLLPPALLTPDALTGG